MQRYIDQLIEDLKEAADHTRPPKMELDPEFICFLNPKSSQVLHVSLIL